MSLLSSSSGKNRPYLLIWYPKTTCYSYPKYTERWDSQNWDRMFHQNVGTIIYGVTSHNYVMSIFLAVRTLNLTQNSAFASHYIHGQYILYIYFLTPTCRPHRCNNRMWKVQILKLLLGFKRSFLLAYSSLICTFLWNIHANSPSFLAATDKVPTHTNAVRYTE
jgi:hypothetical protein